MAHGKDEHVCFNDDDYKCNKCPLDENNKVHTLVVLCMNVH